MEPVARKGIVFRDFPELEIGLLPLQEVCKKLFVKYLDDLSGHRPDELKIIVIDNASFRSTEDVAPPENIVLLPIPRYCPELDPAEKVWQWMKDRTAMKIHDTLDELDNRIENLLEQLDGELVRSITSYDFYINAFYSVFKV